MNPRTRFRNSLAGRHVDRLVRYEHGAWPSTLTRWQGEGLPPGIPFDQQFGFDPHLRLPIPSGYTDSPFWPPIERISMDCGETWEIIRDTDGITKKVLRAAADTSMPQFLRFPVATRRDWETLQRAYLDPANAASLVGDPERLRQAVREEGDEIPVTLTACGAYGHPRNLLGVTELSYTLHDDPGLIHDILANWLALYREILHIVCAVVQVDCFLIWEDMCYKNGPLVSPQQFRRIFLPYYCELVACARENGIASVWVDTDGDLSLLIPLFIEAGVDTLMPFEVQAGMDVIGIRKRWGSHFAIVGGIDKRALAVDRAAIKAEVDRVLPFFLDSGRYIPCLDHTVPTDVSLDNFLYYLDCVRAYESQS